MGGYCRRLIQSDLSNSATTGEPKDEGKGDEEGERDGPPVEHIGVELNGIVASGETLGADHVLGGAAARELDTPQHAVLQFAIGIVPSR